MFADDGLHRLWMTFALFSPTVGHGRRARIDGENEVGWKDLLLLPSFPASSISGKGKGLRSVRGIKDRSACLHAFRAMHGMARHLSRLGRSIQAVSRDHVCRSWQDRCFDSPHPNPDDLGGSPSLRARDTKWFGSSQSHAHSGSVFEAASLTYCDCATRKSYAQQTDAKRNPLAFTRRWPAPAAQDGVIRVPNPQ